MVETIDAVDGLPEQEARTLSRRMWYLGQGLTLVFILDVFSSASSQLEQL